MNERKENPGIRDPAVREGTPTATKSFTEWLIHRAARRAPSDLSERLEEEWQADLAAQQSAASRLRFALGCCWAIIIIVREQCSASIPVASAVLGPKGVSVLSRDESGMFARRSLIFFLVAGLHIGLFYALMTGLAFRIIKEMPATFQYRPLETPQRRPMPPLPPPSLTEPRLDVPVPELPRTEGDIAHDDIVLAPPDTPVLPSEMPIARPARDVVRVPGGPGSGFPTADEYYPSVAKRLEEQGVTTVRVCVGVDGRLTSDPSVAQTSGSPRLDEGAVLLARAGSGHYRPATEDGRKIDSCYSFRVRFSLRPGR